MCQYFSTVVKATFIYKTEAVTPIINTIASKKMSSKQATFPIAKPFKLHKLEKGPPLQTTITSEEALKYFKQMVTCRKMENAASSLYKAKFIRGFLHLYNGQEAIAIGMLGVLRDVDTVITSYRCHAFTYLMGAGILGVLAELSGRKPGCSRGKGGSMHLYAKNFFGGNGIVGAQGPLGAGLALAHKYKGDGGVAFTLYGDGAANQGQLFEAYNIAKLWSLPCVFICENNLYAMGTSVARSAACTDYYTRGDYIPGLWVDGMDICATKEATKFAIEHCTSGKGPLVIEMSTYRYYGHSMSDPGTSYRTREEVQEVRKTRDPIASFKEKILAANLVTEDQLTEIDSNARKEVDKAVEEAKTAPSVGIEELGADLYKQCQEPNNMLRGVLPNAPIPHMNVAKQ